MGVTGAAAPFVTVFGPVAYQGRRLKNQGASAVEPEYITIKEAALIFEDLHWIDAETQDFLDLLVDSVANARLVDNLIALGKLLYKHGVRRPGGSGRYRIHWPSFKANFLDERGAFSAKVALKPVESANTFAGFSERAGLRIRQSDHTTSAALALWMRGRTNLTAVAIFPYTQKVTIVIVGSSHAARVNVA